MWVQFSSQSLSIFLSIIVWAYFSLQSLFVYTSSLYASTILKETGIISLKLGWVPLGHWIDVYIGSFYHYWSKAGNAMVSGVVRCRWWISWVARFTWFHTAFSLPPWLDSDRSHCWTILRAQYETQSKDLGWQKCSDSADPRMRNCSDFAASKMVSK